MEELRSAQEDDMVFIFWGGHGSPDPHDPKSLYLITYDTDPEHMPATAISMQEFKQSIANLSTKKQINIMNRVILVCYKSLRIVIMHNFRV